MEEEISLFESEVAAITEFAKKENINLNTQNEIGRFRVEIQAKKGEWLDVNFPSKVRAIYRSSSTTEVDDRMPATFKESAAARMLNGLAEEVKVAIMEGIAKQYNYGN